LANPSEDETDEAQRDADDEALEERERQELAWLAERERERERDQLGVSVAELD
jgi:hypothetical protein